MAVKEGNTVKVHYTGTFDDGKVFDSSEKHGKPLEFKVGAKKVIKGFDDAVIGMEVGEEKEVKISAKEGYGETSEELIKKVPKESMPKEAKAGMSIVMQTAQGPKLPAKIIAVDEKEVTVDLNHPLAGKNLNFKIKVVEINE